MWIFSTGDLIQIAGTPSGTLDEWVRNKLVQPFGGGGGIGKHRVWTLSQVVGFVVAEQLRTSDRGCCLEFAIATIAVFGSLDEKQLMKELKKRPDLECGYISPHQGKPLMTGDVRHFPSVVDALAKVVKFVHDKNKSQVELETK